jgi:PAS domain
MPTLRGFLDAPPFRLQSEVAIVDVVGPMDMRFRLFGTGLSSLSGVDLTGSDVLSNFHPTARAAAARNAWAAVTTPCGYFVRRDHQRSPFKTHAVAVGLPLLHEQSGRVCLVVFNSTIDKAVDTGRAEANATVTAVSLIRWIDIGAGTP